MFDVGEIECTGGGVSSRSCRSGSGGSGGFGRGCSRGLRRGRGTVAASRLALQTLAVVWVG